MPVETLTTTIHVEVRADASSDWHLQQSGYSDDYPGDYDGGYLGNEFWDNAVLFNPGAFPIKMYYLDNLGGESLIATIGAGQTISLADAWGGDIALLRDAYPVTGGISVSTDTGDPLPEYFLLSGTFTDEREHHYGKDPQADIEVNYTWLDATISDTSTWTAPPEPSVTDDNAYAVGMVRYAGDNWDLLDEVAVPYVTIAVYQRPLVGLISGEYLGSERRFMGF